MIVHTTDTAWNTGKNNENKLWTPRCFSHSLVHWLVPSLQLTNWGWIAFVFVVLVYFSFTLSPSFLLPEVSFTFSLFIEIKLTLMRLYDYFRALKLHQGIAHLRYQFDCPANFILFLKTKVMNVSFRSILSRKSYLNMFVNFPSNERRKDGGRDYQWKFIQHIHHEIRGKKHPIGCFSQFVGSLACSFVATN